MALVNVINMIVLDNPTNFTNPFQFEITFECLQELADDLEWKVLYVGSANDTSKDQILDEILVGPIPVGINKFVLQADSPDPQKLPHDDILGVTVVLVTCSYREREFIRVGYYVNNEYTDPVYLQQCKEYEMHVQQVQAQQQQQQQQQPQHEMTDVSSQLKLPSPPKPPVWPQLDLSKVQRQILADKPRVTKFPIPWGDEDAATTTTTTANQDTTVQDMMQAAASSPSQQHHHAQPSDFEKHHEHSTPTLMDVDMQ